MPIFRRTLCRLIAVSLTALIGARVASAQQTADTTDPLAPQTKPWSIQLEPSIWVPAIGGDVRLPGGVGKAEFERFDVDDPTLTPMGELTFRHERLTISVSGFGFSMSENASVDTDSSVGGLNFPAGSGGDVDVDFFSAQATVGWRVWQEPLGENDRRITLSLHVYGGVRGYDFKTTFTTVGGASVSESDGWVEPIFGARFVADILEDFTLEVAVDAGAMPLGDHTSASLDIIAGIQWRPHANVGVQFGWRQLLVYLKDESGADEFSYEGALAGLFGSVVLRF